MSTPPADSVEGLVRALGDPGRYQVLVMVLLCFNYVPVSVNHLLMAFHGFAPDHNCRVSIGVTSRRGIACISNEQDAAVYNLIAYGLYVQVYSLLVHMLVKG